MDLEVQAHRLRAANRGCCLPRAMATVVSLRHAGKLLRDTAGRGARLCNIKNVGARKQNLNLHDLLIH